MQMRHTMSIISEERVEDGWMEKSDTFWFVASNSYCFMRWKLFIFTVINATKNVSEFHINGADVFSNSRRLFRLTGFNPFQPPITATSSHSCVKSFQPEKATLCSSIVSTVTQCQSSAPQRPVSLLANLLSRSHHNITRHIHCSFWFQCIRQMGSSI